MDESKGRAAATSELSAGLCAGTWTAYNGEKQLPRPGRGRARYLLLIDAPDVAIYDFVTAGHQDLSGEFWIGVPGKWLGATTCLDENCQATHLGEGWIVKAWMPAPDPGEFAHNAAVQVRSDAGGTSQ